MKKTLVALAVSGMASAGTVEHDFGQPSDVDPRSPIHVNVDKPDWSPVWHVGRADLTNSTMAFYENQNELRWVFKPDSKASSYTDARAIKFRRFAKFHFDVPTAAKYVTIRYKDDLRKPAAVKSGRKILGYIGGSNDHRWKSETVSGAIVSPIVIGEDYSDALAGMLPIDRMRISSDKNHGFPPDAPGFWKVPSENRHTNLGRSNDYGEGPMFLFGMYSRALFLGNASPKKCSSGPTDSFQAWEDVGMNVIVHHGWEQNWESRWQQYPNQARWARPNILTEMGLKEMLFQAECHGLKVIPNYLTDTRSYFMMNDREPQPALAKRFAHLARTYRGNKTLLAHNPVDEWDHEDVAYAKPHAASQEYYYAFKENDPDTPVYMSLMGFMGSLGWEAAQESADILANDKYCHESRFRNGESNLSRGCKAALANMRLMEEVVGDDKVRIYIPNFGEKSLPKIDGRRRLLNQKEQIFQAYTGIVGGAHGLIFFADVPRQLKAPGIASAWKGLEQLGQELFGAEGIGRILVAPAKTVKGAVKSSNPAIETLLRRDTNGDLYLITLNMENTRQTASISVKGLDNGAHPVLFEDRSIKATGGKFKDQYAALERHVYKL